MGSDRPPDRSETVYCSACGETLGSSANYCTNCGTASGGGTTGAEQRSRQRPTTTRSFGTESATPGTNGPRSVTPEPNGLRSTPYQLNGITPSDRDGLEHQIVSAARDGWELEHDFGDHAVLVRRTFGSPTDHLLVATVTVWWTMGLGNALYGAYHYFGRAERRIIQAERRDDDHRTAETATDDSSGLIIDRLTAAVCWLGAAVFAAAGSIAATTIASLVFVALAVVVGAVGTATLPSIRRRLDRRQPVTANGRVHSVDERAVASPDRPCAACADIIDRGVERTYREADCLFGIPLSLSEGQNYYCRRCANAEQIAETRLSEAGADDQAASTNAGSEHSHASETRAETQNTERNAS